MTTCLVGKAPETPRDAYLVPVAQLRESFAQPAARQGLHVDHLTDADR